MAFQTLLSTQDSLAQPPSPSCLLSSLPYCLTRARPPQLLTTLQNLPCSRQASGVHLPAGAVYLCGPLRRVTECTHSRSPLSRPREDMVRRQWSVSQEEGTYILDVPGSGAAKLFQAPGWGVWLCQPEPLAAVVGPVSEHPRAPGGQSFLHPCVPWGLALRGSARVFVSAWREQSNWVSRSGKGGNTKSGGLRQVLETWKKTT